MIKVTIIIIIIMYIKNHAIFICNVLKIMPFSYAMFFNSSLGINLRTGFIADR